jgi:SIR2-like domain
MAKLGFDLRTCRGCLSTPASAKGWAICIGAGASDPIFPRWGGLVKKLLEWSNKLLTPNEISDLLKSLSLESLIQSVFHRKSMGSARFADLLIGLLYSDLKANVSAKEWRLIEQLFADISVHSMTPARAAGFLTLITNHYPNSTPLQLAEVLGRSIKSKRGPSTILSFNAEPLLLILAQAYIWTNTQLPKRRYFDPSLRGMSHRNINRIPYHFCHGLLPLPGRRAKWRAASLDKLVFSETDYLNVASSSFSWQSAVFLNAAMTHSLVFVGMSFTDQNLRRWLGFVHANRMEELRRTGHRVHASTQHYWINRRPATSRQQKVIEASTAHLGVRLVWIDDWDETRTALERMLIL